MRGNRLASFQEVDTKSFDDEIFVDLTIYDVPASLLKRFGEKLVHSNYPSLNEAIKDLLRKAIKEQESKHDETHVLTT